MATTPPPIPEFGIPDAAPGAIQNALVWLFGSSWRSSLSGITTALAAVAAAILALCPHLCAGQWDTHEFIVLVLTLIAGSGAAGVGLSARDGSVALGSERPSAFAAMVRGKPPS